MDCKCDGHTLLHKGCKCGWAERRKKQSFKNDNDEIQKKIDQYRNSLNISQNFFGGIFIESDTEIQKIYVYTADHYDLFPIFGIDYIDGSFEKTKIDLEQKLTNNGIKVIPKNDFLKLL